MHPGRHKEWFIWNMECNYKKIFDFYLKDEKNGWDKEPKVWLSEDLSNEFKLRKENEWPLNAPNGQNYLLMPAKMEVCLGRKIQSLLKLIFHQTHEESLFYLIH